MESSKITRTGNERGFTLGQFLLLLSILGVLMSVALPAYISYRIQQINSSTNADVLSLGTSVLETSDTEDLKVSSKFSTTAASGTTIEFPLSTGSCTAGAPGGIEG